MKIKTGTHLKFAIALVAMVATVGCGPKPETVLAWTEKDTKAAVKDGSVKIRDINVTGTGGSTHIRVVTPSSSTSSKLPVVFVAPAGTRLYHGNVLSEGDTAELVPYAKAGMISVGYELDGDMPSEQPGNQEMQNAMKAFKTSNGGLRNAQQAMEYVLANIPGVNPDKIYVAGHSSAANVAIHVATNDPRIKACAAFAPAGDVVSRLSGYMELLERASPGERDFLSRTSPINEIVRVKCPIMLFHAQDDDNIPISDHEALAAKVGGRTDILNVVVPHGGHYNSMIKEGIPQAIKWFKGEAGHGISP